MATKRHYTIDNTNKLVNAVVVDLTERDKKEIKNYIDLGYTLVPQDRPKKPKLTKEQETEKRKANPFSEINIQAFLKENGTKAQQDKYWEIYKEQARDSKTKMPLVYKTSKEGKFTEGEPRTKGHIATIGWFKKEFPNYPGESKK